MDGEMFERRFADLLVAEVDALKYEGTSYKAFARRAFPGIRSPENKWQRIKNLSYGIGKPQSISLSDAFNLARALDLDLARFVARVLDSVEKNGKHAAQKIAGDDNIQVGGSVGGSIISGPKAGRRRKHPDRR
jgi:hypothetical protein